MSGTELFATNEQEFQLLYNEIQQKLQEIPNLAAGM
jgi:hypothetical protein